MTINRIICSVCNWLIHEWVADFRRPGERVRTTEQLCSLCHREHVHRSEPAASWFEPDLGEAGA